MFSNKLAVDILKLSFNALISIFSGYLFVLISVFLFLGEGAF